MNPIKIENLNFGFENKDIFLNMSLEIPSSEISIIIGANGSGKTTLCRILSGIQPDYQGKITKPEKLVFMQQFAEANLLAATPVLDLAVWEKKFTSVINKEDEKKYKECLSWFDLEEFAENPVWELSGGQQQRVALSALLLNKEHYWILDEPAAGLDEIQKKNLLKLLNQHKKEGYGALIVTHRLSLFKDIADGIYEISDYNFKRIK